VTTVSLPRREQTAYGVLGAISFCHLLNDLTQSLLPAMYPLLKTGFNLSFAQVGLITFTYQVVASILQPIVGFYTDRRPQPYSLSIGMAFTFVGLLMVAYVPTFPLLLFSAAVVGTGSAIFHPESSRVARMAPGPKPGFAQAIFADDSVQRKPLLRPITTAEYPTPARRPRGCSSWRREPGRRCTPIAARS